MDRWFAKFASKASDLTGSSWAFIMAAGLIILWAICGPVFGFSEVWQLTVNTGTTIITFLMVFLIQNTQNRDAKALHLKLDEIIHVIGTAHNELIDVEDLSDDELRKLIKVYRQLAGEAHGSPAEEALIREALAARHETGDDHPDLIKTGDDHSDEEGSELVIAGTPEVAPGNNSTRQSR